LKEELLGEKFTSTAEKINALAKIAIGVKSIHNTPFKEEWIFESGLRHFSGPLSHRDLKPGNIFVMRDKDGIKIDIGDYGYVAATQYLIRSGYYTPPKLAQILLDRSPTAQENVLYNRSLGMQHDIWQLGLIFASVLKNNLAKGDNGTIPPLPFMLKWMDLPKWDLLKQIVSLTQKEVDDDIQAEINTVMELALPDSEKYALKKCWKVVLHMLQIEPHKRMYIERVEKKLTKSLKTLGGHNWGGMPDILTS
jgi:serine/threonine protein kinase